MCPKDHSSIAHQLHKLAQPLKTKLASDPKHGPILVLAHPLAHTENLMITPMTHSDTHMHKFDLCVQEVRQIPPSVLERVLSLALTLYPSTCSLRTGQNRPPDVIIICESCTMRNVIKLRSTQNFQQSLCQLDCWSPVLRTLVYCISIAGQFV